MVHSHAKSSLLLVLMLIPKNPVHAVHPIFFQIQYNPSSDDLNLDLHSQRYEIHHYCMQESDKQFHVVLQCSAITQPRGRLGCRILRITEKFSGIERGET
jgi:hypothetical protein